MGHAPPMSEGERERQKRTERWGALIGALFAWVAVLTANVGSGHLVIALAQLVTALVFVVTAFAVYRHKRQQASQQGVETWFGREMTAKRRRGLMAMEYVQELELELDYRLGLKRRPEPKVAPPPPPPRFRFALEGEQLMERPTRPPAKPVDAAQSVGTVQVRPVQVRPSLQREMAEELLRAVPRRGKAWRSQHVRAVAALMGHAGAQNRTGGLLALYDDEPQLYWRDPGEVCCCGHFREAHTPFDMPLMEGQTERDQRKCTRPCECTGYSQVTLIPLDTHGMPSPANAQAYPALWLTDIRE